MKSNLLICTLLAALTIVAFWGVAQCDFNNYDDPVFVTENFHVLGGLTAEGTKWAFTTSEPDYWRPLSWLSHQLDVELFGLKPAGHHITSLLFHVANTLLLFLALRMMTGAAGASAFVAALFAVHPLHVESVAWVAERKDVLTGFFWMLTMLAYAHYARQPGIKRYLLVCGAFVLGLMSKPMAVTLPCALLLLDFWPLKRLSFERSVIPTSREDSRPGEKQPLEAPPTFPRKSLLALVGEKIPLLALAGLLSALAVFGQKKVGVVISLTQLSWWDRISNALVSYFEYLRKTFWPSDLAVFYPHPGHLPASRVILAAVVLAAISAWVASRWRKQPYLAVGWLWFLGTLVPMIGLVQVGSQAMADRYSYIPLIGVFMMLAWAGKEAVVSTVARAKAASVAGVILVLVCAIFSSLQVRHWRNSYTLFKHALAVAPDNALSRLQFGETLTQLGRHAEAEQHLARAVALDPNNEHPRCNYAITLSNQGKYKEAGEQLEMALRLKPSYAPARHQLATVLMAMGRPAEAADQYREAIRLKPDFLEALNNLAWLLATHSEERVRNGAEAVVMAERACTLTRWEAPNFIGTLAAAYAEAGRFNDAIAAAEKARALATAQGNAELAARNGSLLELYGAGRPYHEPPTAP